MATPPPALSRRHPALVWVTQILLILIGLMSLVGLLRAVAAWGASEALQMSAERLALGIALQSSFVLGCILLVRGIALRRRWAWHGGVVFAALFLFLILYTRASPVPGRLPLMEIAPEEMFGAAVAEIVITFLVVLYPFRMFFSDKVRTYFGLPPTRVRRVFRAKVASPDPSQSDDEG